MFLGLGKFAHQRRLVKGLRKRPLDRATVEELETVIDQQHKELPWGLLWKTMELSEKAKSDVREDDPLQPALVRIFSSSIWEIQNRSRGSF
ncbi:hypothetical protein [Thiohalocapsa marina]|uniref:hypothetical protein n=1 Tax=Thiohalocapsa marina TaxID=424902 RepID=UPI0036D8E473